MSDPHDLSHHCAHSSRADRRAQEQPAWANGIKALYDAVTQEPLPPDFEMLLNQLSKANRD